MAETDDKDLKGNLDPAAGVDPKGAVDDKGDDDKGEDGKKDDALRDRKGRWVPKVRLDEALKNSEAKLAEEREARIRLEERLKAVEAAKPQEKVYGRAELLAMVREEKITQEQADEYWEKVLEARLTNKLVGELRQVESQRDRVTRIRGEMERYKRAVPDVLTTGTDERRQVSEEYDYLVSIGQPATVETELAALRSVFGPVERLEKRKDMNRERESFQDGGGGRDDGRAKDRSGGKDPFKDLPSRYKDYYTAQIGKGLYSGWDDPRIKREIERIPAEVYQRRAKKYAE